MRKTSTELSGLAAVLKQNRTANGISLEALCETTGIIPSRMADFEAGTALPSLEQIQQLADAFHKDIQTLFAETGDQMVEQEPEDQSRERIHTCRYAFPKLDGTHHCQNHETTGKNIIETADCDACPHYDSRYIQYPLTIQGIDISPMEAWDTKSIGQFVAVRPCSDNPENKTYLGLYLGEQPWFLSAFFNRKDEHIHIRAACNPMIYVPDTKTIVRGANSWWKRIQSPDDLKDITDDTINNTWYVQLLRNQIDDSK